MEHAHGDGAERTALVRTLMRRQARLGLRIAAVFVLVLVGLPLLNLYLPDAMATPVGGFSLTWLLLAVLFYPVTWLLSWAFVRGSDRIEARIVEEMRGALVAPPPTSSSPIASSPVGSGPSTDSLPPTIPSRSDEAGAKPKRKLFVEDEE